MLADDIAWALPELRAQAEARFTETCVVSEKGESTWDADANNGAGDYVETVGATLYEGPCRVVAPTTGVRETDAGEREIGVVGWRCDLPVAHPQYDTGAVTRGHVVRITGSTADPGVVGKRFTVTGGGAAGQVTARRLPVEEVV